MIELINLVFSCTIKSFLVGLAHLNLVTAFVDGSGEKDGS